jgi:AraC-like DNA-binding protein/CheY-like chemotaxis protein
MSTSPFERRPKINVDATVERLYRLGLTHVAVHLTQRLDEAREEKIGPHEFLDRLLEDELRGREEQLERAELELSSQLTDQRSAKRRPRVLWLYLRVGGRDPHFEEVLSPLCEVFREDYLGFTADTIPEFQPHVLVFDYDYPDLSRLKTLAEVKDRFPSVPILMLIEQRCEGLAIWAFRTGVREYLHAPVRPQDLVSRIQLLSAIPAQSKDPSRRVNLMASQAVPLASGCIAPAGSVSSPERALTFVDKHLAERITLRDVAEYCGFGTFAFSRAFKKEYGITFQEYLVRRRIKRAQQLLDGSLLSITEVAEEAGFGDLSHFIRTFRRFTGSSPSVYRKRSA